MTKTPELQLLMVQPPMVILAPPSIDMVPAVLLLPVTGIWRTVTNVEFTSVKNVDRPKIQDQYLSGVIRRNEVSIKEPLTGSVDV